MKGLFAWVGFKSAAVGYDRPGREAGQSAWSYWKLWNFALDGLTSFSTMPLRVWTYVGVTVSLLAFVYASFLVIRTLVAGVDLPGYASLMVVILFLGGIQLISLGVIGEYLGRVFIEVKQRPVYLVDRVYQFSRETSAAPGDGRA
jgi:glycosyltransferase involved in cell wall biosynthesis